MPGQSSPKVSATDQSALPGNDPNPKNGKTLFTTEADATYISWDEAGCPNRSWPAHVDFVFWTNATISVYQGVDPDRLGDLIGSQDYTCITTRDPATVTCTRVP